MVKEAIIGYIENGTVIDHIPFGKVWSIANLLGVNKEGKGRVSLGEGYKSEKFGRKGILKIEGMRLSEEQLNLIALVAKYATVSIIYGGGVQRKLKIEIPETLKGIVLCPNLNCISNDSGERVKSLINYNLREGFSCHYCSTEFKREELRFNEA